MWHCNYDTCHEVAHVVVQQTHSQTRELKLKKILAIQQSHLGDSEKDVVLRHEYRTVL